MQRLGHPLLDRRGAHRALLRVPHDRVTGTGPVGEGAVHTLRRPAGLGALGAVVVGIGAAEKRGGRHGTGQRGEPEQQDEEAAPQAPAGKSGHGRSPAPGCRTGGERSASTPVRRIGPPGRRPGAAVRGGSTPHLKDRALQRAIPRRSIAAFVAIPTAARAGVSVRSRVRTARTVLPLRRSGPGPASPGAGDVPRKGAVSPAAEGCRAASAARDRRESTQAGRAPRAGGSGGTRAVPPSSVPISLWEPSGDPLAEVGRSAGGRKARRTHHTGWGTVVTYVQGIPTRPQGQDQ